MVEWDYFVQEVKEGAVARPGLFGGSGATLNMPGCEPISLAAVQSAVMVRLFVLLRRPR